MITRLFERVSLLAVLVCLSLLCALGTRAQNTADVVGSVTDASGGILPGVTVTITNTGTNVSQTTQTTSGGDYTFALLQVGTYVVKVEAKGFKTFSAQSISLSAGDRARVDAKMEVGDITQTVEVQASTAPALQTDSSGLGTLVTTQAVEDLPLDGRNIVRLVQLAAGTTEGSPGSIAEGARPDDRRQTSAFSANGQGDSENESMIDGFDNNERIIGTIGARPSIDAIQEVNVSTNKYDASVGRTGGAVVDIITKAGTNSFHGSGFEFFRNKVLNTNPNYNFTLANNPVGAAAPHNSCPTAAACPPAPNPAFRQNQYGGSVGGPIRKDKTFFFVDYEGLSQAIGLQAALFSVPTLCEKGKVVCPDGKEQLGDFSDISPVSAVGGGSTQATGVMGPDITPTSTMGLAFFNMYPLPNTGASTAVVNNYTSAPVKTFNSKTYDGRIDQHFSEKDTLFGRITYNDETTITPNGFPNVCLNASGTIASTSGPCGAINVEPVVTSYAGPNNEDQYSFGLSYVHVYTPNLLLNLKFGIFRSQILSFPANQGTEVSNKLGWPCTATSCIDYTTGASLVGGSGLTHFSVSGLNGAGGYTTIGDTTFVPLGYWDTNFTYSAGLTWNKGSHSIKMGLGLIRRRAGVAQSNAAQGQFNFNGSYTGVAPGDMLEGLASANSRNNSLVQQGFRMWEPSGYLQDDWRARPWLTLNLGVRYDIFTPYEEVHGRISNYDPFTGLLVSPSLPGAQQSNSTGMVTTPYTDLAPRVGFAATLKHNTVVRGGFGLTFFPTNYRSDYYFLNAPFNYASGCTLQNQTGTNLSCASAQYDGPVGQFTNAATATYGLCPFTGPVTGTCQSPTAGSSPNSSSTVNNPNTPATAGTGGALVAAGLPVPVLNIALATNTALYAGTGIIGVPINQQEAYLEQMNLQVQKEFGANVISVGYVGELGRHAEVNGAPENQPTEPSLSGTPPLTLGGVTHLGTLAGYPYLKTVSLTEANNWGTSAYEGLQASFVRRFNKGLTVNFNYAWSHTMSNINSNACVASYFATVTPCLVDSSNGTGATPARQVFGFEQYAWGNDPLDVEDRFTWGVNYQLPFGKTATGFESALIKGWGVNTSGSWQTGIPFSVTASSNTNGLGVTQYLDQIGSGKLANRTIHDWFNLNDFVQPVSGTLGNQRIDQVVGPSLRRLDASLFKDFPIKEQIRLQFRAEVFNLFNSPNFGSPTTAIAFTGGAVNLTGTHVTTGQINSMNATWNQREIQFALKLLF
jgi:hypothetical protein